MEKQSKGNGKLNNFYEAQKVPLAVRMLQFYFSKVGWLFPKRSTNLFWKLFTTPRNRKLKDWHQKFTASADTIQDFSLNEFNYKTYTWGHGPKTVVLVHGWDGMAPDFKLLIEALVAEGMYKVIVFDMPAHGQASGKHSHLLAFMKGVAHVLEQEPNIYALLGHSLGASAVFFALEELKEKAKVEHLMLLGSYPIPYHFFQTFQTFMKIPDGLFNKIVKNIIAEIDMDVQQYSMYEMRYNLPVNNVLLIHDYHDEVANIDKARVLAAEWDKANVFFGDHGGHYKHFRHEEVIQKIVETIRQPTTEAITA